MKVLFLAPVLVLCSGCAAIPPSLIMSGVMGIADMRQKQQMNDRLSRIEAAVLPREETALAKYSYPLSGLKVTVLE